MRILLLYTPRSGTNSLCKYFLKQNPNYEYINQPWAEYQEGEIKFVPYEQCVKHQNVLIKSEISNLDKLNISVEKLHRDFDKIFMTGDISEGSLGFSSTVFQVQFVDPPRIIKTLQRIKNSNHKTNSKNSLGIVYVGEIEYKTAARSHVSGKSHIWIRLNRSFGKVRYYVEIINNNNDFYGEHVKVALETLCIEKCNLIIDALNKLGINLKNNSLKNNVHSECMNFNWTFPIQLPEQNN